MTDPDNPLPEPSFCWRRWLTFATVAVNSALVCFAIVKIDDARALMWVALALVLSNVIFALLYMGGASASDLARIIQQAAILKNGKKPAE
jgi:hypothetical protein